MSESETGLRYMAGRKSVLWDLIPGRLHRITKLKIKDLLTLEDLQEEIKSGQAEVQGKGSRASLEAQRPMFKFLADMLNARVTSGEPVTPEDLLENLDGEQLQDLVSLLTSLKVSDPNDLAPGETAVRGAVTPIGEASTPSSPPTTVSARKR